MGTSDIIFRSITRVDGRFINFKFIFPTHMLVFAVREIN
jgi:hypothetical protein